MLSRRSICPAPSKNLLEVKFRSLWVWCLSGHPMSSSTFWVHFFFCSSLGRESRKLGRKEGLLDDYTTRVRDGIPGVLYNEKRKPLFGVSTRSIHLVKQTFFIIWVNSKFTVNINCRLRNLGIVFNSYSILVFKRGNQSIIVFKLRIPERQDIHGVPVLINEWTFPYMSNESVDRYEDNEQGIIIFDVMLSKLS